MDIAEFAQTLRQRLEQAWPETMKILQSETFLDFCENYPRPKRTFVRADGPEDIVTSRVIFRAKDGKELGPEDYLKEFERFVKGNPEHIEALEILLKRPKDFDASRLKDLRIALATKPDSLVDKFSEKNLRRAYAKELADIISIIRHAARGDELLTTEQRVNKAFMRVKSDRRFNDEQERWLELIRRHLTENLLMEKEDIDYLPIFTREGASWGKVNKVFGGELETVISEINTAIAA